MKELLTEDLLNSLRLMKYDRSRTLMENNLLVEQGPWDSKSGDNKYWVALYNRLKNNGIGVKYGTPDGKETTDPNKSTFLYWGPWIIWKDQNKNGGYPIQLYSTSGSYTFKWKSGKYRGEELNKSIILCGQKKGIDFILTDLLPINDVTKAKKLIGYGGCKGMNETLLVGGVDTYKTAQLTKEFPYCFKKPSQDISKSDPLYNQKIDKSHLNGYKKSQYTDSYGAGISDWVNINDQTDEARIARYKSAESLGYGMYDLIHYSDLGKENNKEYIEKLKYNNEPIKLGGTVINISEMENPAKLGYGMFKRALTNRKNLKSSYNWTTPDVLTITDELLYSQDFNKTLNETSLSTVIDPTFIEAVLWVKVKGEILKYRVDDLKARESLEDSFENSWRFKNGLNPRKKGEKKISEITPKNTKELTFKSNGTQMDEPIIELVDSYGTKRIITKSDQIKYKNELKTFINNEVNKTVASMNSVDEGQYKLLMSSDQGIVAQLDMYRQLMDMIYEHNQLIAELKNEWIKGPNGVCDLMIETTLPGKATKQQVESMETGRRFCGDELYGRYSLKNVCSNTTNQGLFIVKGSENERITNFGIDWTNLKLRYKTEKTPNDLVCMCANRNIIDYKTVKVKGSVGIKCGVVGGGTGGAGYSESFHNLYESIFDVDPRQYMFKTKDIRGIHSKIYDWGKKCFTAANDEGEMGKDFHCILDIASIVSVFIPVVGPMISMIIDVSNGLYYLVDALNAETSIDKKSALFSAGMTILGGLMTGIGDLRAVMSAKPNGKAMLSFADEFTKESANLTKLTKSAAEKETQKLFFNLASKHGLGTKELGVVEEYLESLIKLQKDAPKYIAKYQKTIRTIQGKLGYRRWGELMSNKNFQKIMIQSKGNINEALKIFSKNQVNKDFLIQIGFFVGGESILSSALEPYFTNKIKSGQWGNFIQFLQSNNYNIESVSEEFMVDKDFPDEDLKLLEKAWKETCTGDWKKRCVNINGKPKPWKPGWVVPEMYQTKLYKKKIAEETKQKENEEKIKEIERAVKEKQTEYENDFDPNSIDYTAL